MIKHIGFNYGNFATWDPRTDVLLLYNDKIEEISENISLPVFNWLVKHHEISHRAHYFTSSIQEIVLLNSVFSALLESKIENPEEFNDYYAAMLFSYDLLHDVDPILDACHAYQIYCSYKLHGNFSDEQVAKYLALILDAKSKKIFNEFKWFAQNFPEGESIPVIVSMFSLFPGIRHFAEFDRDCFPSAILYNLMDSIRSILEGNRRDLLPILKKIADFPHDDSQWPRFYNDAITFLSDYNPTLKKAILTSNYDPWKEFVSLYRNNSFLKLSKKFRNWDGSVTGKEWPTLVIELNGKFEKIGYRKNMNIVDKLLMLRNLTMIHLHDCIYYGAEPECYLCEIGICDNISKGRLSSFVLKWHKNIEQAKKNLDFFRESIDITQVCTTVKKFPPIS